jgi:hypothetical protein
MIMKRNVQLGSYLTTIEHILWIIDEFVILNGISNPKTYMGENTLKVNYFSFLKKWRITNIMLHSKLKSWWHLLTILNTKINK